MRHRGPAACSPAEASAAAHALDTAAPEEIVQWAVGRFRPRLAVTSSMTDLVTVHLVSRFASDVPVIFLDTGYHFPETIATRDLAARRYPLPVRTVVPAGPPVDRNRDAPEMCETDPDRCCQLRKVLPLDTALRGYHAWITGLRRADSAERSAIPVVQWDSRRRMAKVNPLAAVTDDEITRYIARYHVPANPLVHLGYRSIGCAPCTRPVSGDSPARSGRWAGTAKQECGLHDLADR